MIAVLLVLAAACTDSTGDGTDGTDSPTTSDTTTTAPTTAPTTGGPTTEDTTEPTLEPTEPETTQPTRQKPSIQLANAPIGGDVDADGEYQCAEVNWLGRNPIPAGTAIRTGARALEPGGIFRFDQSACRPDDRPCINVDWQEQNFRPCYIGVRQVQSGTEDEPVTLILEAVAVCATQSDCDTLVGDQPGSQITFVPDPTVGPSETPSVAPSSTSGSPGTATPSEATSESPSSSPSDAPSDPATGASGG
ncbi:hypothetical protein FB561_4054 [Kribbella amoyensis]|uniref:Uncharacterized protein n=1 Tax=Kribbella amoyensis TaxID=996641 RepID=A0A561BVN7_9ACTN|nr:hypothetical protein FB561_4054 [Kribbella amoyensis]